MNINLEPKKIALLLGIATAVVMGLHIYGYMLFLFTDRPHPITWFNADREGNLPTLFSTMLLFFNVFFLTLITYIVRKEGGKYVPWCILACAFFFLGLDETIQIHEKVSEIVLTRFNTSGVFQYAWVIPYGIAFLIFAMLMLKFVLNLPSDTRKWIIIAGILYVGGAIGLEMVASSIYDSTTFKGGDGHLYYALSTTEELMEMSGAVMFVYAFSNHISKHLSRLSISIGAGNEA